MLKKKNKKEHKPFKDSKAFEITKRILPALASGLADIIPGGDMAKGIIDAVKSAGDLNKIDENILDQYVLQAYAIESEKYKTEVDDRKNARMYHLETLRAGSKNISQMILAFSAVIGFFYCLYMLFYGPNIDGFKRDALLIMLGTLGTIVSNIYAFHFGSSRGSKEKTILMSKKIKG